MKTEQGAKLGEAREGCCLSRGQERAIREGLEKDLPGGGKGKPRPQGGKNLVRMEESGRGRGAQWGAWGSITGGWGSWRGFKVRVRNLLYFMWRPVSTFLGAFGQRSKVI